MSSIDERPGGRLRFRARWTEPDGSQRARHFATYDQAQGFLASIDHALAAGVYRSPRTGRAPLRTYARYWLSTQTVRQATVDRNTYVVTKRIIPRFGRTSLETLHPSDIQQWIIEMMAEGLSPVTVRSYVRVLGSIMLAAKRDRLIDETPLQGLRLPRTHHTGILRPLTITDVHAIANTVPDRYHALIITMAGLGLRLGEATGLTLDRLDFATQTVIIDRQLITPNTGQPHFGPVKTHSSNRRLPLPNTVTHALQLHLDTYGLGPHQLVFTTQRGKPIGRTTFAQVFRNATQQLSLDATSHDLRHHCASLLIAANCPVTTVQHFLGHKNASETLNTYAHLWPTNHDQLRHAIDTHHHNAS